MITKLKLKHLDGLRPNEFTKGLSIKDMLNVNHGYEIDVLINNGVKSLFFYKKYEEGHYIGFLVCAKSMNGLDGRCIKKHIDRTAKTLNIKRLETVSQDCYVIDRWHKFLGFKIDKTDIYVQDENCNLWSKTWE